MNGLNMDVWQQILLQSFADVWFKVAAFLPQLLIAVVLLFVGWLIGVWLGRIIARLVRAFGLDEALSNAGFEKFLKQAGAKADAAGFMGGLVKWFIIAVFLVAVLDIINLPQINDFMTEVVLGYLPRVIVAVLMLLIASVIAGVVHSFVLGAAKTAHFASAELAATLARSAVWVFAVLAIMNQLGIAEEFAQILFTGIVVALSLALGISFGLGGKETAGRVIDRFSKSVDGR